MELKIFDLKTKKISDFLRLFSQLLYSIMVDGKKEFTKKFMVCGKKGHVIVFPLIKRRSLLE